MITDIRLQNFRSYTDASFEIDPGVNIITGHNASGKTNLLEAVLVLCRGSSYRAKDEELIKFGSSWARLDTHTPNQTRVVKIKAEPEAVKLFEIDNKTTSRLSQTTTIPTVLFEPNHLLLLTGSPELRRDFLDELIEQITPTYASIRRHYRRVLSQRNALLKKPGRDINEQLFVWNIRLSELGGKIARERELLIGRFCESINEKYTSLSKGLKNITISYASQFPVEGYETALLRKLEKSTELDVLRGFTAHGPHRDDFKIYIDSHEMEEVASRGEIRSLVLVLKILELQLLESAHTSKPLLLLDDVFSELDTKRRQALTANITGYQTFITTTDADIAKNHFRNCNVISLKT